MATTQQDLSSTRQERSAEELRTEMYRILDELGSARAERMAKLKTEFDQLWTSAGDAEERTVH